MNRVTVAIVTTRNPERIEKCLASLKGAARETPLDVYVVDNATDFDLPAIVKRTYPEAKIIRNQNRESVTKNRNKVFRQCETPYVLTLDDDVIVGEGTIDTMRTFMDNYPEAGIVGAAIYPRSWESKPVAAGYPISHMPYPIRVLLGDLLKEIGLGAILSRVAEKRQSDLASRTVDKPVALGGVISCCSLIRTAPLREVGFQDEDFLVYFDELDLASRMRRKGWHCYQVPGAKALHQISSTFGKGSSELAAKMCLLYSRKHHSPLTTFLTFLILSMLRLVRSVKNAIVRSPNQVNNRI